VIRRASVLLALAAALSAPATASAGVSIGPDRVVVHGSGARAVIERAPFRMSFADGSGRTVLRQMPNRVPVPQPAGDAIGTGDTVGAGVYVPLGFEVGGERSFQHPGGLFTGNQIGGAKAGVAHAPTRVLRASPSGAGAEVELATTDPTRTIALTVTPDTGTGIRVQARLSNPGGVSAFGDSFESAPDEAFHGFGGRHNAIDQRGNNFYNWVEEENFGTGGLGPAHRIPPDKYGDRFLFPNGPTAAYYVQNLMVSSRPYGILVNRTELTRWRMASERPDAWQFVAASGSLDYTVAVGDGPTAVGTLSAINGRHRLPERWATGPMLKRNVHQGNSSPGKQMDLIKKDIANIRRYRFPVEGYAYESWDTLPREFVRRTNAELKRMGIRPIGYVRAYVNDDGNFDPPGTFNEFVNGGYVVKNDLGQPFISVAVGPAALIDFTNPHAVRFWERRKIRPMLDMGFDGFMQDFGEQVLSEMRFYNGESGPVMHNKFPQVYHSATREILDRYQREHPERGKLWMYTRTGFSGRPGAAAYESANFPGDETSDYNRASGLPSLATDMLSRAVGGAYAYSTDIGGYFDAFARREVDAQLLVRWAQWAALTPHFRLHNACCTTGTRMPWDFDAKTRETYRDFALLHNRARPLLHQLWRTALAAGVPPTRPMWLSHQGDREAAKQDQQWMLGRDVLVAPVVAENATSRSVYFPAGCWQSPETGGRVQGPGYRDIAAPRERLPYFFRCGTDPFSAAAGRPRCAFPTGRLSGTRVGPGALGRTRAANRRAFPRFRQARRRVDRFCLTDGRLIRIGYPSRRLRRLGARRERAVLVLTSSRRYSIRRVRQGSSLRTLRRRVRVGRGYRVGRNRWYLARGRRARLVFKVRGGRVGEVGLASLRLTRGRRAAGRFLRDFD
jgi:alpha-D-xyloside xylohydrolase